MGSTSSWPQARSMASGLCQMICRFGLGHGYLPPDQVASAMRFDGCAESATGMSCIFTK